MYRLSLSKVFMSMFLVNIIAWNFNFSGFWSREALSLLLQELPDFCDILQYSASDEAVLRHGHVLLPLFVCQFPPDVLPSDRTTSHDY